MKKEFFIIPVGLLFFVLLIYSNSSYSESVFLFYTRNILIFSFFGSLVVITQLYVKDIVVKKKSTNIKLINTLLIASGFAVMMIIGQIQINIIQTYNIFQFPQFLTYNVSDPKLRIVNITSKEGFIYDYDIDYYHYPNDVVYGDLKFWIEIYEDNGRRLNYISTQFEDGEFISYEKIVYIRNVDTDDQIYKVVEEYEYDNLDYIITQYYYQDLHIKTELSDTYQEYSFDEYIQKVTYHTFIEDNESTDGMMYLIEIVKIVEDNNRGITTETIAKGSTNLSTVEYEVYKNNLPTGMIVKYSIDNYFNKIVIETDEYIYVKDRSTITYTDLVKDETTSYSRQFLDYENYVDKFYLGDFYYESEAISGGHNEVDIYSINNIVKLEYQNYLELIDSPFVEINYELFISDADFIKMYSQIPLPLVPYVNGEDE